MYVCYTMLHRRQKIDCLFVFSRCSGKPQGRLFELREATPSDTHDKLRCKGCKKRTRMWRLHTMMRANQTQSAHLRLRTHALTASLQSNNCSQNVYSKFDIKYYIEFSCSRVPQWDVFVKRCAKKCDVGSCLQRAGSRARGIT